MKDWSTSSLTIPMSIEDAKKFLRFNNKMLSKSALPWAKEYWKFWEDNLDVLARNFVKARTQGVLDEEWEQEGSS
jgi:hypothetical protein